MITKNLKYYDPYFTVFKPPRWRAKIYKYISVNIWGSLPAAIQRRISRLYANMYNQPYSKRWIKPYIKVHYQDPNYLDKFIPPNGKDKFESFQDFFVREFKNLPQNPSFAVWPCEGLLCDQAKVSEVKTSKVKGHIKTVSTIFGVTENQVPSYYSFVNVFLHNKNYHRIHSPVSGVITRVQHLPGDLVVLRPWIYKQNPSLPAFRNERYVIDIKDTEGKTWYLSIVGGPAVGTISIQKNIKVGNAVNKLDQLAVFYLGSTCCMASPHAPKYLFKNDFVVVGASY